MSGYYELGRQMCKLANDMPPDIWTGPRGYLTAPWAAPLRAAEIRGRLRERGDADMPDMVRHPYLAPATVSALGAIVGALSGGRGGFYLGGSLGSLVGAGLQQRSVENVKNRRLSSSKDKDEDKSDDGEK